MFHAKKAGLIMLIRASAASVLVSLTQKDMTRMFPFGVMLMRVRKLPRLLLLVLQTRKLRSTAGTRAQKLHSLVLQEEAPVRRLPTIDDAPRPTACAAADVQVVSSRGTQAAMSYRHNRIVPVG